MEIANRKSIIIIPIVFRAFYFSIMLHKLLTVTRKSIWSLTVGNFCPLYFENFISIVYMIVDYIGKI